MIPAAFDYHSVDTVPEAIELLDRYGEDAKLLAGGQSLLAVLKLRLAKFGVHIDLGRIKNLRVIAAVDGRDHDWSHSQSVGNGRPEGAFQAFRDAASEIGDPLVPIEEHLVALSRKRTLPGTGLHWRSLSALQSM